MDTVEQSYGTERPPHVSRSVSILADALDTVDPRYFKHQTISKRRTAQNNTSLMKVEEEGLCTPYPMVATGSSCKVL